MTYTEEQIEEIIEENERLKEELDEVKEQLEEEREYHEIAKADYEEAEEHIQCLRMKLTYRDIKIKKLERQLKEKHKEIEDIETTDKQFKEQLKKDIETDNQGVAIINFLDNQFYRVKRNNEYLKILLSNEKQTKNFYRKICMNFFIDRTNEISYNDEHEFEDDGVLYKKFELDTQYIDLEEIPKEQKILLTKMLEEVSETIATEYEENSTIQYLFDNEFRIDNKEWNS